MLSHKLTLSVTVILAVLTVVACGGMKGPAVQVSPMQGSNTLAMEASSFEFKPDHIQMNGPGRLVLEVTNNSMLTHNITVRDPNGKLLVSTDLPSDEATRVELNLNQVGKYEFNCDKPLHTSFGMKGYIEVMGK